MSHTHPQQIATGASPVAPVNPNDDPGQIILGKKNGVTLLGDMDDLDVLMPPPLPGIVIFVHGVNSDGEWYTATEKGLCAGLNDRLKRCDHQMTYATAGGGQLTPAKYMSELTPEGFINPNMKFNKFMKNDDHFTPAIHFRWGYKASARDLQQYGRGIYLNESDYWGGGPFANGCTSLPDLWTEGLSENLLLWIHIETVNPTKDRNVFSCPPRPYYVLAALRLARLIESIRKKQADVPITIVCHSQGNMIGMAAAFFGDAMAPVRDAAGVEGRCVADTYVLCNAPYSLKARNATEDWGDSRLKDRQGGTGRQSRAARIATLRAFLDIIRQPASRRQTAADINQAMENSNHPFNADTDCKAYGYGARPATCGRVTNYCNPHDQVISSTPVQGIGWLGMSQKEIDEVGGAGILSQRVFAQGYDVGKQGDYDYWDNHYNQPARGSPHYWVPTSPSAKYSISRGLDATEGDIVAEVFTVALAPVMIVALWIADSRINALPDKHWKIPIDAPPLPLFKPQLLHFGQRSGKFHQGSEAPGQLRDVNRARVAGEPYTGDRAIPRNEGDAPHEATDAAQGDADSEASMRYEDHARLRMRARRVGRADKDGHVEGEDHPDQASADYKAWHDQQIKTYLAANVDAHATDHSTIMTNDMHAQNALAYDVAIGLCHIGDKDMHTFRIAADWRFLDGLHKGDPNKVFKEYFEWGLFTNLSPLEWTRAQSSEGRMPDKIVDVREHPPLQPRTYGPGDNS